MLALILQVLQHSFKPDTASCYHRRHVMLRSFTVYCVRIGHCCYCRVSDLHSLGPMEEDATLLAPCGVTATVSVSNFLIAGLLHAPARNNGGVDS